MLDSIPRADALHARVKAVLVAAFAPVALASLALNFLALATPLAALLVYNKVLPHQAASTLTVVTGAALLAYLFDFVLRTARTQIATLTGARLHTLVGRQALRATLSMPLATIETMSPANLAERLRQLEPIRAFLAGPAPMLLADLVFSFVLLAALLLIEWRFALVTAVAIPLFLAIALAGERQHRYHAQQALASSAARGALVTSVLASILSVKTLRLEQTFLARHDDLLARAAWQEHTSQQLAHQLANLLGLLYALLALAIMVLGAILIMDGTMSIGALIAANMMTARILSPIRQITGGWHSLTTALAAYRQLQDLLVAPVDDTTTPAHTATDPLVGGSVAIEHLHYRYPNQTSLVLADINATLEPGTITAIVGPAGGGKSTLGKLIIGACSPSGGRILIGGADIARLAAGQLKRAIGYLPQDCQLFSGTLLDNIVIGSGASEAQAVQAAQIVGAHSFITSLADGYQHILGNGGQGLSGGQRQLLCLARAIVHQPPILILDEPTAALDAHAEQYLLKHLLAVTRRAGLTVLIITHRSAAAAVADTVLTLANGRLMPPPATALDPPAKP